MIAAHTARMATPETLRRPRVDPYGDPSFSPIVGAPEPSLRPGFVGGITDELLEDVQNGGGIPQPRARYPRCTRLLQPALRLG